jgi:recombination protein RecA
MRAALLKAQIEQTLPSAFTVYPRKNEDCGSIPTGIAQIDEFVRGIPLHALTEICGSNLASSGKTSVLVSLLAQATRDYFCALVDAGDGFDPASGQAAGIALPRLLWVRCGKSRGPQHARFSRDGVIERAGVESRVKLPPLEQAFKVADILLQSGGFGLIAVDLSGLPERIVRKVPLSSWFRFSRVIERQPAALVFIEQEPHATSCAGLVLRVTSDPAVFSGNLLTQWNLNVEVVRGWEKKPARSERRGFSLQTQWA